MPPEYNTIINHPVQTGWLAHGRDIYDLNHGAMLTERFAGSTENIEALLAAVALAGSIADEKRMRHESQSRHYLRLLDGYTDAEMKGESNSFQTYSELAGRPERLGKFIDWFSTVAEECFSRVETRTDLYKVGLELGGMRQAGDWGGTAPIDEMAQNIPLEPSKLYSDVKVKILQRGEAVKKNYVMQPLDHVQNGLYNPNFAYALVRRRRGAADIAMPGRQPIQIFKESAAVVAINQLDEKDIQMIRAAYQQYDNFAANNRKNSRVAGIVGREFERNILEEEREHSLTIIPISAHYVMVMHRP